MVKTVADITAVGVPRILPSRAASLAGLQPKVNPSGNSPSISQEDTSPKPVRFGSRIEISSPNVTVNVSVGYVRLNGRSRFVSRLSQISSASSSLGTLFESTLSVPHAASISSDQASLSSSRSSTRGGELVDSPFKVSGMPSPSLSTEPAGSSGNTSGPAVQPPLAGT